MKADGPCPGGGLQEDSPATCRAADHGTRGRPLPYDDRVNDTHPAAAAMQHELLRRAGAATRAAIAVHLSEAVIRRSRRALAERMPGASELDVKLRWVEIWYGPDLAGRVRRRLRDRGVAP